MDRAKQINYFPVDNVDMRQVASNGSRVFNNEAITIILNGRPSNVPFLRAGQVYQLPEPRLLLVTSGEAEVHLELESYHVGKGSLILTPPDAIMEFERCSDDTTICGIAIKEDVHIQELIVTALPAKDFEQLLRMLYLLWDVAAHTPFRCDAVRQMTQAMISNAQYVKRAVDADSTDAVPSRSQQLFRQFKTLVSRHCDRQRNIPFYAAELRITPHHLSAVVSKASGHSVMYWINRAALLRAKVLLKTTDLLAYEIAARLNFPNASAFNHFFKREAGMTPKSYKASSVA